MAEDYCAIDLAWLRRRGCLKTGTSGRLTWSWAGRETGSVGYRSEPGGFRLIYRARRPDQLMPGGASAAEGVLPNLGG
jgi:hypothetical protein